MEQIPSIIHESWHPHLQPLFDNPKMAMLKKEILPNCKFYPASKDIFRVFSMPLNEIKVVILGQDPYPNGEAIGLAFAVKDSTKTPASLKVIANEIINEKLLALPFAGDWKSLSHWAEQGVFLLNTALTVEVKNAGSHLGMWQWFTREVIKIISTNNPCIWMLWGAKAQGFSDYIQNSKSFKDNLDFVDIQMNYRLEAPHPAAEMYNGGTGKTFSGCNHFNLCNQILTLKNQPIINW